MSGENLLVTLKNVEFGEQLFADTDEYAKDANHRSVFTCQNQNETGPTFLWNITGVFSEGTFRVRLASTQQNGEILFAPIEKVYMKDTKRRYTYTSSDKSEEFPKGSADWFMESDTTEQIPSSHRYKFKNVLFQDYLYAEDSRKARDEFRRNIFTYAGSNKQTVLSTNKHLWDITVVETPVCEI